MTNTVPSSAIRRIKSLGPKRSVQLSALIGKFDREAQRCASIRAYYAACVLQAAVLEGLLVAMCDAYLDDVHNYLASVPAKQRPQGQLLQWDLGHLIATAIALEWLPACTGTRGRRKIGDWLLIVKETRNLVHPGRHLREYPSVKLRKAHYSDCYTVVRAASDYLWAKLSSDLAAEMEKRERLRRRRTPR